jgi:aminoglycoside phosphotransferase (APT) family kinase protein
VLHRFSGDIDEPSAIAKLPLAGEQTAQTEAAVLAQLGEAARRAGADLPRTLSIGSRGARPVALQSAVAGRTLAELLSRRPERLADLLERVADWLARWHALTQQPAVLDAAWLSREVLEPAVRLMPLLPRGDAYLAWLTQRCERLAGTTVPLVASHNDLSTGNLLFQEDGQIGVVDWEGGRTADLPLMDLFYAIVEATADAETARAGLADRLAAFADCFEPAGSRGPLVTRLLTGVRRELALSDEQVELCFHACWLRQADDERRLTGPADRRPFLQIVGRLAEALRRGSA